MMDLETYEQILPHVTVDGMIFYTPNKHTAWRVETLYTKEVDTIEWLQSMKPGEILFDVGANVGLYSIFAAKRGVKVYAFEPESQNFAVLQKNIVLNKLDNCTAFPICFSNVLGIDTLRLSGLMAGGSCHSFGADVDFHGAEKQFPVQQGSVALRMEYVAAQLEFPDHVKIDVDGFEHLVLDGAREVISRCKSILCEMDSKRREHMEWHDKLELMGFQTDPKQIAAAMRSEGTFKGIGNRIYTRKNVLRMLPSRELSSLQSSR